MAAEASGTTGGDAAVNSRIHNVKVKLDEVEAAQASAKWTGRAVTLVLVLAILAGIYLAFYLPIADAVDNKEAYGQALEARVEELRPQIQAELQTLVDELRPQIREIIEPRLEDEWLPKVQMAAEVQLAEMGESLREGVTERITTTSTDIQDYAMGKLKSEIPDLDDTEKMARVVGNMEEGMKNVVERVMGEYFGTKVDMVVAIETNLVNFPVPEKIQQMSDEELSQYMNELIMAFAAQQFESVMAPTQAQRQLVTE